VGTGRQRLAFHEPSGQPGLLVFSAEGRRLAVAGGYPTVTVWDVAGGSAAGTRPPLFTLKGHTHAPTWLAFYPDGRRLFSADLYQVKVWDIGPRPGFPPSRTRQPCALSPGGTRVVTVASPLLPFGDASDLRVSDVTGKELRHFKPKEGLRFLAPPSFCADGSRVAGYGFRITADISILWAAPKVTRVLWAGDVGTGRELLNVNLGKRMAVGQAFSPDGKRLALVLGQLGSKGVSADELAVWDLDTGQVALTVKNHRFRLFSLAWWSFSPEGTRLVAVVTSAGGEKERSPVSLLIWDVATGKELVAAPVEAALRGTGPGAFSRDGRRVAHAVLLGNGKSARCRVKVWDAATGRENLSLMMDRDFQSVRWLEFSPDGTALAALGEPGALKVWDAATGRERFALKGRSGRLYAAAYSPDGKRLATVTSFGDAPARVQLWDTTTGRLLLTLPTPEPPDQIVFTRDSYRLVAAFSEFHDAPAGPVQVWDATPLPEGASR
jgi:WD40 repeat protein